MALIERFLGVDTIKVSYDHLIRFIGEKIEEGLYLDYKAIPPDGRLDYDKLCRVISGFANSAGGLLIVGVSEDASIPGRIYPGQITWAPPDVTKERVERSLATRLSPPVPGMQIVPIREPSGIGAVFLLDVSQSEEPPHMAIPFHAYYKRLNFETVPMEHYEVADLFGRRKKPALHFAYRVTNCSGEGGEQRFQFEIFVCNTGPSLARNTQVLVVFSPQVRVQNEHGLRRTDDVHGGVPSLEAEVAAPRVIHRNQAFRVGWAEIRIRDRDFPVELKYSIVAEDVEEKLSGLIMRIEDLARIQGQFKMDAPQGTRTSVSIRTI